MDKTVELSESKINATLCLIALLLGLGWWLFLSPVAGAADVRVHIRTAHNFFLGLIDEGGYPDWDATAYGGRGNPMLRFVGPLPLVFTSLLQLFGCDDIVAVKVVVLLFATVGLIGTYKLMASLGLSAYFSWAALFVMIQPLISFHLGVAFLFQNLCAHFLAPWLWLSANRIWQGENKAIYSGGLILGLIVLTHPYFALMIGYAWGIIIFSGWLCKRDWRFLQALIMVPLLAGLLAAPYVLPAWLTSGDIYYKELTQVLRPGKPGCEFLDEPVRDDKNQILPFETAMAVLTESPGMHATSILQMKSSPERLKALHPWLFIALLLSLMISCIGTSRWKGLSKNNSIPGWVWLLSGCCCAIMTLKCSTFIYAILPGAMAVQFPFRWLLPAFGLWLPVITASVAFSASTNSKNVDRTAILKWAARVMWLLILVGGLCLQSMYWPLPNDSMASFFASPGHLSPFYPRSVPRPGKVPLVAGVPHQVKIASGTSTVEDYQAGIAWMTVQGVARTPVDLHINTHFDPYWRIQMESGETISPQLIPEDGTIKVNIPAGPWKLLMDRRSPVGRTAGWFLMVIAIILIGTKLWKKKLSSIPF